MDVSFYLKRKNSNKPTVIFARICYNGHKLKHYTNEKIHPDFWNASTQRAKQTVKFREHPEFNERLKNIESDIRTIFRKYQNENQGAIPAPETLKELLDKEIKKIVDLSSSSKTFLGFFEETINQSKSGIRLNPSTGKPISPNTLKTYVTTFKHLTAFQSTRKRKIDFNTIDLEFYGDYTEYLIKELKLSTNTIGKHIQIIKLIMNEATERGINTNLSFKGKRFTTVREDSDSIYLTESDIREISNLDLSADTRLEKVRDLFLIGCFTGLRYSDYSIIKSNQINDGFIEIKQTKTGGKVIIPVHSKVKEIIEKYNGILPESISNQKTNEYLKEIGQMIPSFKEKVSKSITKGGSEVTEYFSKWELLTTHTARRSFATNQFLAGVPNLTIMAITGHKTEKSFLRYIKLTPKEHAKLLKLHWEDQDKIKIVS